MFQVLALAVVEMNGVIYTCSFYLFYLFCMVEIFLGKKYCEWPSSLVLEVSFLVLNVLFLSYLAEIMWNWWFPHVWNWCNVLLCRIMLVNMIETCLCFGLSKSKLLCGCLWWFFKFLLIWALCSCQWCDIILCIIKYDRLLDRRFPP
jgi:hypothetical protein